VLQEFLQAVSDGTATVPIGKVYTLDEIVQAHTDMEESRARGKLVVTT
jgi:NADPH:quinone reductase-like Zn-dependent oxidoreductase